MRIALISKWLARESARFGPGGGFVQQTAEALIDRGHEVIGLSQKRGAQSGETMEAGRVPVDLFCLDKRRPAVALLDKVAKSFYGPRKLLTDALEIRRFLSERGPFDAVWAQGEDPDGTACGVAARLGKIPPVVITVQAVRWNETATGNLKFTQRRNLRLGFSKASLVAANSPLCAKWLQHEYGVPLEKLGFYRVNLTKSFLRLAALARKREQVHSEGRNSNRILFLGALNPTKAPDIFLEAAARLAAKEKNWHFVLVGGETEKNRSFAEKLEALRAASELKGRITFTGALEEEDVAVQIVQSRLVVCPSRIDTLSRATVESLVTGRPVVVAENVGARYLVEGTGAGLVTRCEPQPLAEAMSQALADSKFFDCAQSHAEALAEEHSAARAAEKLEALLEASR